MALRLARIPIITENVNDILALVDSVNSRIDEINRVLQELEVEHSKAEGKDANMPKFFNNLNLQNHKLVNVARSKDPQDVVTRRELEELGLLGNRADGIKLSQSLTVDGSVTVTNSGGGGGAELATNSSVFTTVTNIIGETVATSVSGTVITTEDIAGTNGTTAGTLAMAREGNNKAEFLQLRNGELITSDPELRTLLCILIEEVRALRNES